MPITCPYCAFSIDLTGARPGRFTPACPNCHQKFLLTLDDALTPTASPIDQSPTTQTFATYQLLRKLADGATGSVYHAKHLTLNRDVALKIFNPELSRDTSAQDEARRAASLSHPNVVTVYDTGRADNAAYIAYELLPGPSLSDLLLRTGPLPARQAAIFTKQAAQALLAIHRANLLHKDIKPANRLLADATTVKLTDLGPTVGTPAYMAPEQIHHTALSEKTDVYNLGATLYELLTARPPFTAATEQDLLAQHLTAPVTPPDVLNASIPPTLARLAVSMLAKAPEDRPTTAAVLDTLDAYLATDTSPTAPEHHRAIELLETAVDRYNHAPLATLRPKLIAGFYAACALLIVLAALLHSPTWAGGWTAFAVLMTLSYLLLTGITGQSAIPSKLRELLFTATLKEWLWRLGVAAVLLLVIYLLNLHWLWLTFAVIAGAVAAAFHFSIDAMLAKERREPLEQVHLLLKSMRLKGDSEQTIQEFVYKNAGPHWEPFYESLFGYDAKLQARQKLATANQLTSRRKYAPWRDPVIAWIDTRLEHRRGQVAQRLADMPISSSRTEIVPVKRKSNDLLIPPPFKSEISNSPSSPAPTPPVQVQVFTSPPTPTAPPETKTKRLVYGDEDESGQRRPRRRSFLEARYGSPIAVLVGPHIRLLLSLPLLLGFALWAHQNNLKSPDLSAATSTINKTLSSVTGEKPTEEPTPTSQPTTAPATTTPLELPGVPNFITHLFYDYRPAIAGLLLLLSSFSSSTRRGLLIIPAAAIIFFAPLIPFPGAIAFPKETTATILGAGLSLLAFLLPAEY